MPTTPNNPWIEMLKQFNKLQKTHSLQYTILKTLTEAVEQDPKLPFHPVYQQSLKSLPKATHSLTQYHSLIHSIWSNDTYPINVREQCCQQILKTVTQWIMEFEVKADSVNNTSDRFRLVREFVEKRCGCMEMTLLVVDQIFEDLKELFDQSFWGLPEENEDTCNKEYSFVVEADEDTAKEVVALLELLVFRGLQSLPATVNGEQSPPSHYLSTFTPFTTPHYHAFTLTTLNYLLCLPINQSFQSQATKLALEFTRSVYSLQHQPEIISLFKRLMLRTKKSVRYALVEEYIETYRFLQELRCDRVIEGLEDMVYFRELVVGFSKVQDAERGAGGRVMEDNVAENYFREVHVKAGSKERVFFAVQDCTKAILKLELILDEGMDINLKIYHLSSGTKEVLYHEEPKTELRRLDLKIDYMGLYAVEFDNTYSWIHGKKVRYHLHVMKKVDDLEGGGLGERGFNE